MSTETLVSVIARAQELSLAEVIAISHQEPGRLWQTLADLEKAGYIKISGVDATALRDVFSRHLGSVASGSSVQNLPFESERRALIGELKAQRPKASVSISQKGFNRALAAS